MDKNARYPEEEVQETGFRTMVTYRNYKTNEVMKSDPYILRVVGDGTGNKSQYWERPAGSGNLFNKRNEPVGRWDATKPEGKRYLPDAEHIAYQIPESKDQKLARESAADKQKIAALEKELAAVKAEAKRKEKGA